MTRFFKYFDENSGGGTTGDTPPKEPSSPSPDIDKIVADRVQKTLGDIETKHQEELAAARQQEKDKLYGRLSSLEESTKAAQKSAEEAQANFLEASKKLREYEDSQLKPTEKSQKELERLLREESEKFRAQSDAKFEELQDELKRRDLELYKSEQMRLAGEDIIPEMVGGSTKEEIDQSIQKAKEAYTRIYTRGLNYGSKKKPGDDPVGTAVDPDLGKVKGPSTNTGGGAGGEGGDPSTTAPAEGDTDWNKVADLDPSDPKYAESRSHLKGVVSRQFKQQMKKNAENAF